MDNVTLYLQENIISDAIFKWKLKNAMDIFNRGDFALKSKEAISFWIRRNFGKITPNKKNIIAKYYPEILKYI